MERTVLTLFLVYLLAGCVSGLIAGLFGLGGGVVIVPVLLVVFGLQGVDPDVMTHMAVASSLAVIILTSLTSIRSHWRLDGVDWAVVGRLAPGIVVGALLGTVLADQLSGLRLQQVFACFLLAVALILGLGLKPRKTRGLPSSPGQTVAGAVIGGVSALVGVGGGTLTVPFLVRGGMIIRRAVGTSAACGLPIALAGTLGYSITGWGHPATPPLTSGYVYWPAVAGIAVASMALAPVGARLAHRLPRLMLERLFALVLLVVALRLFWG